MKQALAYTHIKGPQHPPWAITPLPLPLPSIDSLLLFTKSLFRYHFLQEVVRLNQGYVTHLSCPVSPHFYTETAFLGLHSNAIVICSHPLGWKLHEDKGRTHRVHHQIPNAGA